MIINRRPFCEKIGGLLQRNHRARKTDVIRRIALGDRIVAELSTAVTKNGPPVEGNGIVMRRRICACGRSAMRCVTLPRSTTVAGDVLVSERCRSMASGPAARMLPLFTTVRKRAMAALPAFAVGRTWKNVPVRSTKGAAIVIGVAEAGEAGVAGGVGQFGQKIERADRLGGERCGAAGE